MTQATYHVELIGSYNEGLGYIWYVFKNLESNGDPDREYIACVRLPNWNCDKFNEGDVGYVTVKDVIEGEDRWFDGKDLHFYNYSMTIFLKFKHEKMKVVEEVILD
ncbi:MAG: hypothetical protein IJ880_15775 [Bacilli bacterium]|nr:hypothetical protein [Bacilli bacterium]